MKKIIGFSLVAATLVGSMWPAGFAKGYQVKNRDLCQKVQGNPTLFKFTAGGIMRGEQAGGTLRSGLYVDGLKKGMLFSLKQCFDSK